MKTTIDNLYIKSLCAEWVTPEVTNDRDRLNYLNSLCILLNIDSEYGLYPNDADDNSDYYADELYKAMDAIAEHIKQYGLKAVWDQGRFYICSDDNTD